MINIITQGKKLEPCPSCKGKVTNYRIQSNTFRCRLCGCVWEQDNEPIIGV